MVLFINKNYKEALNLIEKIPKFWFQCKNYFDMFIYDISDNCNWGIAKR